MFDLKQDNPSLCGYCKSPARGYLLIDTKKTFGACSMSHLRKLQKGEKLKNKARLSEKGLHYAIKETKQTYLKIAKTEKTWTLHEWSKTNREKLFANIVREYLNFANYQAETGKTDFGQTDEIL
ncbi:MAG: hypothetical protein CML81_08440 [Rhodobiaceae bacterium]|nr:hypothetical protein [Rhodobiaceae bacterium]RPF95378.1 MAG: hypothetical protein CBD87_008385 [Rhizobiales bacterium TMED227]|tara:strand:- start:919 stop:1290 length:372 start_codon:yes stop_codon:yes gene_type:complete